MRFTDLIKFLRQYGWLLEPANGSDGEDGFVLTSQMKVHLSEKEFVSFLAGDDFSD